MLLLVQVVWCTPSSNHSLGCIRMGLASVTLPGHKMKRPPKTCKACHLVWRYLSCFKLSEFSFVLHKHVMATWPTLHCSRPSWEGDSCLSLQHERGVHSYSLPGRPAGPRDQHPLLKLCWLRKALFHPVLDCFIFTDTVRYNGQNCLNVCFCGWHSDDLCNPPLSWSLSLELITGTQCFPQVCYFSF